MLSKEIASLEHENQILKNALKELGTKMEQNEVRKPKSCQYCKNYLQHYIKGGIGYRSEYTPVCFGHCTCGVPLKKGGKKYPRPDETCPYFELGTTDMKLL